MLSCNPHRHRRRAPQVTFAEGTFSRAVRLGLVGRHSLSFADSFVFSFVLAIIASEKYPYRHIMSSPFLRGVDSKDGFAIRPGEENPHQAGSESPASSSNEFGIGFAGTSCKAIRSYPGVLLRTTNEPFSFQGGANLVTNQSRIHRRTADSGGAAGSAGEHPDRQQARLTAILTELQKAGSVSVEGLGKELQVSHVTVRRDLDTLEAQGLLRRTHGGAVSIEPLFYEPFRNDRSFQAQVEKFADEKRRIGRAAAALIQKGNIIALTPGTTTTEVVRGLPRNLDLTVVTSTVNVAMELSKRKDLDVYVTGGHLHGDWFSLVGPTAAQSLSRVTIHVLFIGADGIDAKSGASCFDPEEAQLNAAMVKHARKKVAVVDHSKFGIVAGWRICPPSEIDVLVTDSGATDEMIAPFEKADIEVIRV
jgi:DeoR/GlpR family transcriptional regulator of sugar metabolism